MPKHFDLMLQKYYPTKQKMINLNFDIMLLEKLILNQKLLHKH